MLLHSREGSGEHRLIDINGLVEESLNLAYHGAGRAPRSLASPSPCSDPSIRPPVKSTCFRRTSPVFC
jgi:hypothetical protein